MPGVIISRVGNEWDQDHTFTVTLGKAWSASHIWRRGQGLARLYGKPNWRDHTACKCKRKVKRMPKVLDTKVGTRNREASASSVEWLIDGEVTSQTLMFDMLLDTEGEFYSHLVSKGLLLEDGEDYRILDSDGNETTLKSAPEKVRRLIVVEIAERLNCPTSVKVPDGGGNVAAASRNWVSFRPRIDSLFVDEAARTEYIEKNS